MLSSMAGGGQAGEVVLWDAPSGATSLCHSPGWGPGSAWGGL